MMVGSPSLFETLGVNEVLDKVADQCGQRERQRETMSVLMNSLREADQAQSGGAVPLQDMTCIVHFLQKLTD